MPIIVMPKTQTPRFLAPRATQKHQVTLQTPPIFPTLSPMRKPSDKIIDIKQMQEKRDAMRTRGQQLVFTNGCFDILHAGHIDYLSFARQQGDALVVGLNSDASVKRNKGENRPINNEKDRAFVLAALEAVDFVVLFDDDEPKEIIAKIIPDILVKGEDWAHYVSGREIVEAHGGKVVLAKMVEGRSTTNTIDKILSNVAPTKTDYED